MGRTTTREPLGQTDPFARAAADDAVGEVYEVLRTAVLDHSGGSYRLELVKRYTFDGQFSSHHFTIHAYHLVDDRWKRWYDFPLVHQDKEDVAMGQAFNFLADRV